VTATPGIALSILTADCAPLLFADPEAGVIGACHAGWKGAVNGIISNTINEMQELGARPDRIVAAIGPTISGPNYEVGPDFAAEILTLNPVARDYLFVPEGKSRTHFDLPGFAICMSQLAGVRHIERIGGCTFGDPDRYFSHRQTVQNGREAGRQIAIITLAHATT
jgi:YfiH family protein